MLIEETVVSEAVIGWLYAEKSLSLEVNDLTWAREYINLFCSVALIYLCDLDNIVLCALQRRGHMQHTIQCCQL